jgi:penicillin-insensitive murein DD-endopeptidase
MDFLRRRDFINAGILWLLFVLFTKVIPYLLIIRKVIYDGKVITLKAGLFAKMLSWPLSRLFSTDFVTSYYFLPIAFVYYLILAVLLRQLHDFLKSRKLYKWVFISIFIPFAILWLNPNMLTYLDNVQSSQYIGTPGNGKLINGKRLLFSGENFEYFNFFSYLKGNCYVHDKVKQTLLDAYEACEITCPDIEFYTGEGSKKEGGAYVFNHRTHQNGTSVDLMLVFKKDNKQYVPLSILNAYGYGINTDSKGKVNKSIPINFYSNDTQVDFETNAKFLLALDDACRKNGIRIRIVILKVALKPYLFATPSGKKLLARNIRFANSLPYLIDQAHDDHFHIDFEIPQ